jgi:glyceraldehyde-3-phosphate dehydrogenase (NAD(P))
MKQKIALVGYGVIGKRVADAVALQDDMELSGVCEVINSFAGL